MKAKLKQLISSLLVAALLLQMAPFEALAADSAATADPPVVSSEPDESTEAAQPDGEFSYDDDASPPETYIEGEVMEARDEYEKHYRLTDGSFLAAQFQVPVHYEADGSWEDIDNTLDSVALYDGTEVYQTVNGDHVQSFASTLADGTVLSVADGEQSLTMALWDGEEDATEDKPVVIDQEPEDSSMEEQPDAPKPTEPVSTPEESTVESEQKEASAPTQEAETSDADNTASDAEPEALPTDDASTVEPENEKPEETQPDESAEPAEPETTEEETEPEEALPAFNRETKAEILTGAASPVAVQSTPELREVTDVIPETLENSVIYRDVYPGVDLKYETFSYNVKESIILNAPAAQSEKEDDAESTSRYVYTFLLTLDGLTPTLQEDGSILLQNGDGETEYTIPAPYMEDSEGNISTDVTYTLEESAEGWLLTVQADPAWLDAEDRAYPVTIDPTIVKTFSSANIKSTTTYSTASPTGILANYQMIVGETATYGELKMFFKLTGLPKVPAGHTVIGAQIGLTMCDNYAPETIYLGISKLTSALTDDQYARLATPWTDDITYGTPMDYLKFDTNSKGDSASAPPYYWDITNAAKEWYEDSATNYGLAVTSVATSYKNSDVWLRFHQDQMTFLVAYRNTAGTESYYTYETQDGGRAGTGYVGDYSSELTVMKTDVTFPNSAMSYSLGHVFNSGLRKGNLVTSELSGISIPDYSKMKMGYGWQLTAQESVKKVKISGTNYLVYRDSDGTQHYCPQALSCEYHDEDGLGLTFISGSEDQDYEYIMTDTEGNQKYFWNGYLMYMADPVGNRICFLYNGVSYNSASLVSWCPPASGAYLTSIVSVNKGETNGNTICTFSYTDDYLTGITDWAGRTTTFTYTGSELTQITHPDKTDVYYTYTSGQKHMSSMYDDEAKYGVAYTYTGSQVVTIREFTADTYNGTRNYGTRIRRSKNGLQETVYQYDGNDHKYDSEDDIITRYSFDYSGRTINAVTLNQSQTQILGVTAAAYTSASGTAKHKNRIEKEAQSGQNGVNILTAGGAEVHDSFSDPASSWVRVTYPDEGSYSKKNAVVKSGEKTHHGNRALKSYLSSASTADSSGTRYAGMYQTVTLSPGTYTFSAYVNTTGLLSCDATGGIYAAFADKNGKILASGDKLSYATNTEIDDGWERVFVTYTVTTADTYRCMVLEQNAYGPVYYDDLQLETGTVPSNANLLQNGSFDSGSKEWAIGNFHTAAGASPHSGVIEATADPNAMRRASQTVPVNGPATNTYLLSGWAWAPAAANNATKLTDSTAENNTKKQFFGLIAKCTYSDATKEYFYMPFNGDYDGWQYASCVIAPKKDNQSKTIQSITVITAYDRNINTVWYDNISLRQEPCTTYTYDSNGNITAVNATGNSGASFKYAAGTTDLTESNTKSNGTYKYTYNSNHLVTKIKNDGVTMDISYDTRGNSTGTTLSADSDSSAGKLVTSAAYSGDGSQLTSQTDANGSTTTYTYNTQRTVSSQADAKGTTNYHSYFSENDRPKTNYISGVISAGYEYSCGNLVTVRRSGYITSGGTKQTQYYHMGYDGFGNMTSISVGSRKLASYDYGTKNSNLRSMTYGNGAKVSYTYDTLGRVTEESWDGTAKYQYFYNAEGDLAKKLDVTTGKAVNYEYDSLGRLIHSYQTDNGTIQQHTEHLYDTENRLVSQSWQLGSTLYKEAFTYDSDDGSLTKVDGTGFTAYAFSYDALKRLSSRYNWIYRQNYTYRTNGSNQTTQIASIDYVKRDGGTDFSGFKLSYTYAQGGNIATITGTTRTDQNATYSYDKQGQLTKEINTNGTYNYTYDTYGNIRSVSGAESHTYTYDDSEWLDLLTAYDGKSITYDAIGNPAVWHNSSGDWNLSWANGRQLTEATKGSHIVSYTYDLAGIRNSKTVDGVTYNYITQNGQVVRQTWGSHALDIIYDNTGKPYALNYDGIMYYYVLNLQGDVIAIVTTWGETYGTYTYDAWGNVISQSGSIASINPIRYRGYYYDSETGLYYLQSRYYDPQVRRFINADGYASVGQGFIGYNMFAYCINNPVAGIDATGEMCGADDAALLGLGLIVGGIVLIAYYATTPSYQRNLQDAINEVYDFFSNDVPDIQGSMNVAAEATTTVPDICTKACDKTDAQIRRRNKKDHFWLAIEITVSGGNKVYIPGQSLSYKEAISAARAGKSIFADSRHNAYIVARAASNGYSPDYHYAHKGGRCAGYYRHYHVRTGRKRIEKKGGHIFFLW